MLGKRVNDEFDRVKQEIDVYKQRQLEKAAIRIEDLIGQITKDVVASSLSQSDQKELIFRALEQAKIEGMFGDIKTMPTPSTVSSVIQPSSAAIKVPVQAPTNGVVTRSVEPLPVTHAGVH
jgi:hypothetical protein